MTRPAAADLRARARPRLCASRSSRAQVIRGIQGACSCNGAPSLVPSCSSRCSTSCRRSPCSHTRDGRNRADRFVCQAYDGLQEFIQRAECRSSGCRRLAHKEFHPSVHLSGTPLSSSLLFSFNPIDRQRQISPVNAHRHLVGFSVGHLDRDRFEFLHGVTAHADPLMKIWEKQLRARNS